VSRVTSWARKLPLRSSTQKLVLMVLADHADVKTWSTIAGQELLAEEAALSLRAVRDALAELEALGVIHRARRHRKDGSRTSDRTTLNRFWQSPGEADATTAPDHQPARAASRQEDPQGGPHEGPETGPQPDPSQGPTGSSFRHYRQQVPGNGSPEGPPVPSRTVVVDLSSRARSPRRPPISTAPDPAPDPRILAACQLLAARDLAARRTARLARGHDPTRALSAPVRHPHAWHAAATRRRLDDDGPRLAELAARHPHEPARALAARLEPSPEPTGPSPWLDPPPPPLDVEPAPAARHALLAAQAAARHALHRALEHRSA